MIRFDPENIAFAGSVARVFDITNAVYRISRYP
jgi:hypothetical protein